MDETIEIESERFSIDWTYTNKNTIKLNEICWFIVDYRLDSWHIIVVTRQKLWNWEYYRYDLDHWVSKTEIRKILTDSRVKILKINNYHNSDEFPKKLGEIYEKISSGK